MIKGRHGHRDQDGKGELLVQTEEKREAVQGSFKKGCTPDRRLRELQG